MIRFRHIVPALLSAALGAAAPAVLSSCSDDWDNHYETQDAISDSNVDEMIAADPELTTFAKMLQISGYDKLLASSQTFTVFAPENSALTDVDLNDVEAVRRVVANHIARFNCSTATSPTQGVKMLNGKRFFFEAGSFGGAQFDAADLLAQNGILHKMKGQIPYVYNLREYIDTHSNTSDLSAFLSRFDTEKLDVEASVAIGVDSEGRTVYDSVLVSYNPIFDDAIYGLGAIANEDSTFTMLVPDNAAYQAAYERIRPYFNAWNADQAVADSLADVQTSLAIVSDLVYRARITDPFAWGVQESTSGSEFESLADMFAGTTRIDGSNGIIYLAPVLNYDNTLTFQKEIEIEGEEQTGRTISTQTTINVRTVDSSNPFADQISEMKYLEVLPRTTSAQPMVTFSIPDVLSGAYDIYVSFVPENVLNASAATKPSRLKFTLRYMDTDGKTKSKSYSAKTLVTNASEMTLMKVAEGFEFPVANFTDRLWLADETHSANDVTTTTTLQIQTNVTAQEANRGTYVRRFNVDRIILVPVKK